MKNFLFIFMQHALPKRFISFCVGKIASSHNTFIKTIFISWFIKRYQVNMQEAAIQDYKKYKSFNDFFTRPLKPNARPIPTIKDVLLSPADGMISAIGKIHNHSLVQAKNHYYSVSQLTNQTEQESLYFKDGSFATIYLSPKNYHRVHMPLSAQLTHSCFIPGQLFAVNNVTTQHIPRVFSRNERLVFHFKNDDVKFIVVMVGAMIVSSIQPIWQTTPIKNKYILHQNFSKNPINFQAGDELGRFLLGSTAIVILPKDYITWRGSTAASVRMGNIIGHVA